MLARSGIIGSLYIDGRIDSGDGDKHGEYEEQNVYSYIQFIDAERRLINPDWDLIYWLVFMIILAIELLSFISSMSQYFAKMHCPPHLLLLALLHPRFSSCRRVCCFIRIMGNIISILPGVLRRFGILSF